METLGSIPGSLCRGWGTLTVRKHFLMSRGTLLHFSLCSLLLVLLLGTTEEPGSEFSPTLPLCTSLSLDFSRLTRPFLTGETAAGPEASSWPFSRLCPVCPCLERFPKLAPCTRTRQVGRSRFLPEPCKTRKGALGVKHRLEAVTARGCCRCQKAITCFTERVGLERIFKIS